MADKKISQLTAASAVGSTDLTVVVQGSANFKATMAQIATRIAAELTAQGIAGSLSIAGGALTPAATFTRATIAYWNGTPYAINEPRFVDPSINGVMGLLNEEASANLAQFTEDLSNAFWTKGNSTITANAVVAPNGTLTADKLVDNATNSNHNVINGTVFTVGQPASMSVYLKAAGRNYAYMGPSSVSAYCVFDLVNGTVVNTVGGVTGRVEAVPGYPDWFRCSVSTASATNANIIIGTATGPATLAYVGDGVSGIYAWGIQGEAKTYTTTYIPRLTSAAVTRNAETTTVATAGLLTPSAGSVIIIADLQGDIAATAPTLTRALVASKTDGAANNAIIINRQVTTGAWRLQTGNSSGTITSASYTATLTGAHVLAGCWDAASSILNIDGVDRATALSPNLPSAIGATEYIGSDFNGQGQANSTIRHVFHYTRKLSAAERAALTTNPGSVPPDFTAYYDWTQGVLAPDEFAVDGRITAEHGLVVKSGVVSLPAASISDLALSANVQLKTDPHDLPTYAKAALSGLTHKAGRMVFVTDATGGAEPCFSDGSAWRRSSDRTVVT